MCRFDVALELLRRSSRCARRGFAAHRTSVNSALSCAKRQSRCNCDCHRRVVYSSVGNNGSLEEVFSDTPTVLLAGTLSAAIARSASRLKIRSVLPLVITTHQLVAAIAATVAGFAVPLPQPFFPVGDEIRGIHSESSNPAQLSPAEHLTAREGEVLRLVALGQGNKEIAAQLNISEHTVKFHVSSVLAKLGARSRTEAVTIGILHGLVAI